MFQSTIINTVKVSAAAILAIFAAHSLGLEFAVSSGVVAILSIQPTKKETIRTACERLIAFVIALFVGFVCFEAIGYTLIGYSLYIFIFTFLCIKLRWQNALTMNSVLISHFLTFENMKMAALLNECGIFVIGVSIGVLTNLHLRKNHDYIEVLKKDADEQIKFILNWMSERIVNSAVPDDKGSRFEKLKESIRTAQNFANINYNNQLSAGDVFDIEYLKMREAQCQVLYEMYKMVYKLKTTPFTAQKVSSLLKDISLEYHQSNSGVSLQKKFRETDECMKRKPLPESRTEFEDRAKLYALLRSIEEFIDIKVEFANKHFNTNKGHF